jgi:parallel beta-helix repeat protein
MGVCDANDVVAPLVDGLDHPGLRAVVVSGFTVTNANFEGILVTNAAEVTISGNLVTGNDKNLNPANLNVPCTVPGHSCV